MYCAGRTYRRRADSIFARALIWPFCTLRGELPSSPSLPPPVRSSDVLLPAGSTVRAWVGRSEMVSRFEFFGFCERRGGGWLNFTFSGSMYCWRGTSPSSHGRPSTPGALSVRRRSSLNTDDSHLTFAGILGSRPPALLAADFPLRQLLLDTLVAAVDTLRTLPLLYRVNADVLVAALLVPELRQLLDVVDAESTDAALTEAGEIPRWRDKDDGASEAAVEAEEEE